VIFNALPEIAFLHFRHFFANFLVWQSTQ